jgi:hypothetical protein
MISALLYYWLAGACLFAWLALTDDEVREMAKEMGVVDIALMSFLSPICFLYAAIGPRDEA